MNALEQYRVDVPPPTWETETRARVYQVAGVGGSVPVSGIFRPSHHGSIRSLLPFHSYEIQITEATQQHCSAIDHVKKEFVFRNAAAVSSFLEDHRTVPQGLIEALPDLRKHFGQDTVFALEVWAEEGVRELYVFAIWYGAASEGMQSTIAFNEAWAERSCALGARVNVSYELA